jgi:integrase
MRGDGRIFLRGQTWWASFYLNGREIRQSCETDDEKKATRFLKDKVRQTENDKAGIQAFLPPKSSKTTCGDLLDALQENFRTRGKLSPQNLSNIKRVKQDFGTYRATAVTGAQIERYANERVEAGAAKASVNRVTQLLSQSFRLAVRRGELHRVPYFTRLDESDNVRTGFFEPEQFRAVREHLPEYLKDFAVFGFLCGMRMKEIKSLRWVDVQGDSLVLRRENSKGGKHARVIPMVGELSNLLKRRREAKRLKVDGMLSVAESELIFHKGDGQPIGDFRKSWKTACKPAGVSDRRFHDLRRTCVRGLEQAGISRETAKRITGHRTDATWARYAITTAADVSAALLKREATTGAIAK